MADPANTGSDRQLAAFEQVRTFRMKVVQDTRKRTLGLRVKFRWITHQGDGSAALVVGLRALRHRATKSAWQSNLLCDSVASRLRKKETALRRVGGLVRVGRGATPPGSTAGPEPHRGCPSRARPSPRGRKAEAVDCSCRRGSTPLSPSYQTPWTPLPWIIWNKSIEHRIEQPTVTSRVRLCLRRFYPFHYYPSV